jgi:hypothetical protein
MLSNKHISPSSSMINTFLAFVVSSVACAMV